jgi:hypothetical protein
MIAASAAPPEGRPGAFRRAGGVEMIARLLIALVLVSLCAVDSQASGPRFTGRVHLARGGGRYRSMYRRQLQMRQKMQKQMMKEQMRIAAQEKAEAEAAEKRRHEKLEAAAAANRDIKQKEKERGERARRRNAESAASSKRRPETAKPTKSSGTSVATKKGTKPARDVVGDASAADGDRPK